VLGFGRKAHAQGPRPHGWPRALPQRGPLTGSRIASVLLRAQVVAGAHAKDWLAPLGEDGPLWSPIEMADLANGAPASSTGARLRCVRARPGAHARRCGCPGGRSAACSLRSQQVLLLWQATCR